MIKPTSQPSELRLVSLCDAPMAAISFTVAHAASNTSGTSHRAWYSINTVGRHPDNTLQILDRIVSKEHAQIIRQPDGRFLFRDLGSQEGEASALDSLGYAHQQFGQHAEAAVCYRQALELHRAAGSRWGVGDTLGHLGDTCAAAAPKTLSSVVRRK